MYSLFFIPRKRITDLAREMEGRRYDDMAPAMRDARDAIIADTAHEMRECCIMGESGFMGTGVKRNIFGNIDVW